MRDVGVRLAIAAVAVALAAIVLALAPGDARPWLTRVAILALGLAAARWLFRRLGSVTTSTPERFEAELARPAAVPPDLPGLKAVDHTVRMAMGSSFGVEFMLKPLLRDLARWRLLRLRGIDMDATPELARRTVGERLWSVVQPAEPRPTFGARGVALDEIRAHVDELERI
jgi:hypothetical protein